MSMASSDQNEDNEFIENFDKKFITIPKKANNIHILNKNDISIDYHDPELPESDNHLETPSDILEQSRGKVMNSHSMKSLNALANEGDIMGQNASISRLKAKKEKAEKILKNRFTQYKQKLSKSINKLESICQENFGGLHNINQQLSKHQLSRQQLVQYYAKMLPPHSDLPRILEKYKSPPNQQQKLPKLRSLSEKRIPFFSSQPQKKAKKQLKHNKWYIDPQKRFSISNDKTLHDWRTEEGVRNVIRTEELRIKSKEIGNLIRQVKQKFNREPVFCKYVRMT